MAQSRSPTKERLPDEPKRSLTAAELAALNTLAAEDLDPLLEAAALRILGNLELEHEDRSFEIPNWAVLTGAAGLIAAIMIYFYFC